MKSIYDDPEAFDKAVAQTVRSFITRFGADAEREAWEAARRPSMTSRERAYSEAVANRVTREAHAIE
jgi:hypothetical protein